MISVRALQKSYLDGDRRVEVIKNLDLSVTHGTSLAVTGPSGSGKSTLLNILSGILLSDAGTVSIGSSRIDEMSERERTIFRRQHIGYVHQFFNLVPTLTVWENVALPASLNQISDGRERSLALLSEFGLDGRADAFPDVLSGGEQQRVAVARALVIDPLVVLADEPTGNLDRANTELVSSLLFGACKSNGTTLVIATHSDNVAAQADEHLSLGAPSS